MAVPGWWRDSACPACPACLVCQTEKVMQAGPGRQGRRDRSGSLVKGMFLVRKKSTYNELGASLARGEIQIRKLSAVRKKLLEYYCTILIHLRVGLKICGSLEVEK